MLLLALAALAASQPVTVSQSSTVFTATEMSALSERALKQCGYASPQDLMVLPKDRRLKVLSCLITATVEQSGAFLPKIVEPGVTIVAVSNFQGLPIFDLQFSADHPRSAVPKNQTSDYDDRLSSRTCNDNWLGGLIDAGMIDGAQSGAIVGYKLQTGKREILAVLAVAECLGPESKL